MPDTWIKVRDDLDTDPRVSRMAAFLAGTASHYVLAADAKDLFGSVTKAVTRNALRDVTLAGLTRVWSHACRHTTDGIFRGVDLNYLDDLSRIPGFGQAMQLVGWAAYDAANGTLTLPNFEEHNAPDKNGQRSQTAAARRAQRFRDRQKALAAAQLPDPPVNEVTPVNSVTQRDDVTSRVTPPVTPHHADSNVTPSISSSSSSSISESENTEQKTENPGPSDLTVLDTAKARLNRLRGSWNKLPHWSAEEEAALFAALPNLRAMEPQDWAILAFWLRWCHSKANTDARDPVRVTSRRHAFVTELAANLDRAVTHWKQSGSPRLNPDGTKAGPPVSKLPSPTVSDAPDLPPSQNAAAFLGLLKANGATLPPKVATNPAAA